jgi:hypothetical protein
MNVDGKLQSRRTLLTVGACSLGTARLLENLQKPGDAATSARSMTGDRALVCVYLFGGQGGQYLADVPELQALHRARALAVVRDVAPPFRNRLVPSTPGEFMRQRYGALRFLPNGFATPEWAARMAGIGPRDGAGAFTFESGVSLVSMDGRRRAGGQHENAMLRQAMNRVERLRVEFPATGLGRQLDDVSRLIRVSNELGLKRPVFLSKIGGFTSGAKEAGNLRARYQELGQAFAAFHAATLELGLERQITTYTDAELPVGQPGKPPGLSVRLMLGGSVYQRDHAGSKVTADSYIGALARWHGVTAGDMA